MSELETQILGKLSQPLRPRVLVQKVQGPADDVRRAIERLLSAGKISLTVDWKFKRAYSPKSKKLIMAKS